MGIGGPPAADQVEVNLFGPGYGECCVIHLGSNRWAVIDSCIDSRTQKPSALTYLELIGVNYATCVDLILVTHWHDDHIRGISKVVAECPAAIVCVPAALSNSELLGSLVVYEERHGLKAGSGVSELIETLNLCRENKRPVKRASSNMRILTIPREVTAHGLPTEVWALSPSDLQIDRAIVLHRALLPAVNTTMRRAPEINPNHLSVATMFLFGSSAILMGADLEETGDEYLGWSAVVSSINKPSQKAHLFKIPHHGSANGHLEAVWTEMLVSKPVALISPYNKRVKLPRDSDLRRLLDLTEKTYVTNEPDPKRSPRRQNTVEKQIRETVINITSSEAQTGHIRVRFDPNNETADCSVELMSGACHASELLA